LASDYAGQFDASMIANLDRQQRQPRYASRPNWTGCDDIPAATPLVNSQIIASPQVAQSEPSVARQAAPAESLPADSPEIAENLKPAARIAAEALQSLGSAALDWSDSLHVWADGDAFDD
jgi:hypothetical protein